MIGAEVYGGALFSLSEELGSTEVVLSDLNDTAAILRDHPDYIRLLDTPAIPVPEKLQLIESAFAPINEEVRNLLCILCEKHAIHLLPAVAKSYAGRYDEARGILNAEAITAIPLTEEQSAAIAQKLAALTGKKIRLKNTVDRSILGGVKLRYSGVQLDHSVRTRLDTIEASLKQAIL